MGHSTGISGLKTGVESLKKGQDLEDWTAHPHRNFPGIPPPPPREKESHIQTKPDTNLELTKKERFLLFCSYLPQFNSVTVGIVLFSKVDKFH